MARWITPSWSRALAESRLVREHGLRVQRRRRQRVVDVVRDAAGNLSQRAQAFLLHHRLLGLAQVLVGSLKGVIEPRLVRGQCHVAGQLPQEFAVVGAEGIRGPLGDQQGAEHFVVLGAQRRGDHHQVQRRRRP